VQLRHLAAGIGRFRVNAFVQQGRVGHGLPHHPGRSHLDELGLPPVLKDVAMTKRGLVIFVGGTGTGKNHLAGGMVDYRNENTYGHIITIEDPIEFVHPHKNCIVTQREVGVDTDGWEAGAEEHPAPGARRHPDGRNPRPRDDGTTPWPSPKPATCVWPRCTPTAPTRRSTASSTSSPKSAASSC
jgi:Tfp pilus assembly pilus retraction ATPase PilT